MALPRRATVTASRGPAERRLILAPVAALSVAGSALLPPGLWSSHLPASGGVLSGGLMATRKPKLEY